MCSGVFFWPVRVQGASRSRLCRACWVLSASTLTPRTGQVVRVLLWLEALQGFQIGQQLPVSKKMGPTGDLKNPKPS